MKTSIKIDYGLLAILLASFLLSLLYCPPLDQELDDREFFRYAGMAILRGQVPYKDFFDHKPPLIYFINAAGQTMGLGAWGLWIISTTMALWITILLFRRARQYQLYYPWLLPLLFNLMIRDFLISGRINMTREYSTFFVMLFFCVFLGKSRYRYFLLGLLTGMTFFTQQDQILCLLPFWLYTLLAEDKSMSLIRGSAGFITLVALFVVYFALHHALTFFWEDAFRFNLAVYIREPKSPGDHFRTIKRILDHGNYEIPFMVALSLGITSLFGRHKKKGLMAVALAAMFLSMSSELMGGRVGEKGVPVDFLGYFLPLSATVCIVLFVAFAFTEHRIINDRQVMLPYVFLLCTSLCYTALQHAANLKRRDTDEVMNRPELPWLRQQHLKDYQLFALFDDEYIYYYNELKILAPSQWVYQHLWQWYIHWDPDHQLLSGIGDDLLRHHTTYVIMDPQKLGLVLDAANRDWWRAFMQAHYQSVPVPGREHSILWKLKQSL